MFFHLHSFVFTLTRESSERRAPLTLEIQRRSWGTEGGRVWGGVGYRALWIISVVLGVPSVPAVYSWMLPTFLALL